MRVALVTGLLAAGAGQAVAQGAGVTGVVRDSAGRPLDGAEVGVLGAGLRVRTDSVGAYRIGGLMAGRAIVTARRLGYVAESRPTTLADGAPQRVDFALRAQAALLDPTNVVAKREVYDARLAGFNERVQNGVGHYVTRDRIDRANSATLADVLREIPGVRVSGLGLGVRMVRIRGSTCPPLVFVDGFPATAGEFDLDMVDLAGVEGIEVYSGLGSLPPEFTGPRDLDRCGVIAIWSRPARAGKKAAPAEKPPE